MTFAHIGMPSNGNIKPDNKIDGKKKNMVSCTACNCVLATAENVKPTAKLAAINGKLANNNNQKLPTIGIPNNNLETKTTIQI